MERLYLPRTVSMKKPIEERKVLEEVEMKEFIMLGEKPADVYRRKESFRAAFVIKHKLRREGEKEYFVVGVPEVRGKREKAGEEGEKEEEEEVQEERGLRRAVVEREGYR